MFDIPWWHDERSFDDGGLQRLHADAASQRSHSYKIIAPREPEETIGGQPAIPLQKVCEAKTWERRHPIGFNAHAGRNLYTQYLVELALRRQEKAEFMGEPFQKAASLPNVDYDPELINERLWAMRKEAMADRERREGEL